MTFASAIRLLNEGRLLARAHWPRGCYVGLVIGNASGKPQAFLAARTADGQKTLWIASDDDVGAGDWGEARELTPEEAERLRQRRIHYLPEE